MPTSLSKYLDPTGLDETVLNIRQLTEDLEAEIQELPYARPDGIYPDMTVGAVIGADDTAQWATRESTGSGSAIVRSVQGAAVAFAQICYTVPKTLTAKGVTYTCDANGEFTVSGSVTESSAAQFTIGDGRRVSIVQGHKYISRGGNGSTVGLYIGDIASNMQPNVVYTANSTAESIINLYVEPTFDGNQYSAKPQLFDLTAMFGSGNEPATVAEFEAMYPEAYYPYSAPTLKPVQIAGIESTDAQGGELDAIEWTTQTLRAAGSVADMLYSDHVDVKVGVYTFTGSETLQNNNWESTEDTFAIGFPLALLDAQWPTTAGAISDVRMAELETISYGNAFVGAKTGICLAPKPQASAYSLFVRVPKTLADNKDALMLWLAGKTIFYALATPTTTPINPALLMTYKVQQGGSERIIVPDGEVSAAPVLTVAEPVNMSTELARIWEAIQSLGYTRNAAQLSRADTVSIDEVQKDTAEKDTTKEVTE